MAKSFRQREKRRNAQGKRLIGIKQGSGGTTTRAFGKNGNGRSKPGVREGAKYGAHCLDAFHPSHLPLPRAIGGYTTIRLTTIISASDTTMCFAPYYLESTGTQSGFEPLLPVAAYGGGTGAIDTVTRVWDYPPLRNAGLSGCTLVPAALSVQVMNPEALQTSTGIVYIGRMHTQPTLKATSQSWTDFATNFISYNNPRLCSAGKLALRGVQVDAVPFNMSVLSDFKGVMKISDISPLSNFLTTWDGLAPTDSSQVQVARAGQNKGFAPIVVHNPEGVSLQYLVCTEYRVRFDPTNPAQASHVTHPVTSDQTWGRILRNMEAAGNGALDIAEKVAHFGMRAAPIVAGLSRTLPMLTA